MSKNVSLSKRLSQLIFILIGNTLVAFGISHLLISNHIITGGVSGIGLVVNHYFHLPLSYVVAAINIVLFFLGYFSFGKDFAFKTIVSTFYFPIAIGFFENKITVFNQIDDLLIVALLAGALIGLGVGLILKAEGSSGGIDILALFLSKHISQPVSLILNGIDFTILALQLPFNEINHIMYGIVTIIVTAIVLDRTLVFGDNLCQVLVISDKYEEVRKLILFTQDAGLTLLQSKKGFTQAPNYLLMTIIPKKKLPSLKTAINSIDENAFIIVSEVNEVGCKGFKQLRSEYELN